MKFQPFQIGNTIGKSGRPKGSRNRLSLKVLEEVLGHALSEIPGRDMTKLKAALEVLQKTRPADYVRCVLSTLPKELVFSDSAVSEMADDQIEAVIKELYQQRMLVVPMPDETVN
jgi:hypothetical protein